MPLSRADREAVERRAGYRCEYCRIVGWELQVDHIVPRSARRRGTGAGADAGSDDPSNLAAACAHCNRLKGDFATGRDPLSGREVRLFHPRSDAWEEHFAWSSDYLRVLPLTEVGGATIARLRMNDPLPGPAAALAGAGHGRRRAAPAVGGVSGADRRWPGAQPRG